MMKKHYGLLILILFVSIQSCNTNGSEETKQPAKSSQSDENYTGIKKFYEGEVLKKEINYVNGIKEGICNNYYDNGKLKRTIWYKNDIREDTAKWYYMEGNVYRATPYKNDKIHGIQTKYHKNGRVMAEIPYKNGLRTPGLKEYYDNGLEVGNIPTISIRKIESDDYASDGVVSVSLVLSNKSTNVKYYKGGMIDGALDKTLAKDITASSGMAYFEMFKTETGGKAYVDVVAEYTTRFRNRELIVKRVKLPYNDLR